MPNHNTTLLRVMQIDAWLSFYVPVVFLACVPLLVVVEVPDWVVAATVLTLAFVLGACGVVMAGFCALAAARGRREFPDEGALTHFHLVGPVGTRGLRVR